MSRLDGIGWRRGRRPMLAALALLAVAATGASAQVVDPGDFSIYATAQDGGALTTDFVFAPSEVFEGACLGGFCLYSATDPGFITRTDAPPGMFPLAPGTSVTMEVVSIAEEASVLVGSKLLDAAGETAPLGVASGLHVHPTWQVTIPPSGTARTSFPVVFRLTAPGHAASPTYTLELFVAQHGPTPSPATTASPTPAATGVPTFSPTATPTTSPRPTVTPAASPRPSTTPVPTSATPAPSASARPTASPTPKPGGTASPTPRPSATAPTPRPSVTPARTATPGTTSSPEPTDGPPATPSPRPSGGVTPSASGTPVGPTASPRPTVTIGATATPRPSASSAATRTPRPTSSAGTTPGAPTPVAPSGSTAHSRGDQLLAYFDARDGFTSFVGIANTGAEPLLVRVDVRGADLRLALSWRETLAATTTRTIDVGALRASGLGAEPGLLLVTAIDGTGAAIASDALAGNFTVAHLDRGAAWGAAAIPRRARVAATGAAAPGGTIIDGATVVLETIRPSAVELAAYHAPATLDRHEVGGNQVIFASFDDVAGAAPEVVPAAMRWVVDAVRQDGAAIEAAALDTSGVEVTHLEELLGADAADAPGRLELVARTPSADNRLVFFAQSLGSFATGYLLPPSR